MIRLACHAPNLTRRARCWLLATAAAFSLSAAAADAAPIMLATVAEDHFSSRDGYDYTLGAVGLPSGSAGPAVGTTIPWWPCIQTMWNLAAVLEFENPLLLRDRPLTSAHLRFDVAYGTEHSPEVGGPHRLYGYDGLGDAGANGVAESSDVELRNVLLKEFSFVGLSRPRQVVDATPLFSLVADWETQVGFLLVGDDRRGIPQDEDDVLNEAEIGLGTGSYVEIVRSQDPARRPLLTVDFRDGGPVEVPEPETLALLAAALAAMAGLRRRQPNAPSP